jgi:hypothetical protein
MLLTAGLPSAAHGREMLGREAMGSCGQIGWRRGRRFSPRRSPRRPVLPSSTRWWMVRLLLRRGDGMLHCIWGSGVTWTGPPRPTSSPWRSLQESSAGEGSSPARCIHLQLQENRLQPWRFPKLDRRDAPSLFLPTSLLLRRRQPHATLHSSPPSNSGAREPADAAVEHRGGQRRPLPSAARLGRGSAGGTSAGGRCASSIGRGGFRRRAVSIWGRERMSSGGGRGHTRPHAPSPVIS